MPSIPIPRGRRRSQRQSNRRTLQDSEDNSNHQAEFSKGKKRKKDSCVVSDDLPARPTGPRESLEEVGVHVGQKTSRERLLELLAQRVKPKKPRLDKKTPKAIRPKNTSSQFNQDKHRNNSTPTSETLKTPQQEIETVTYSVFHESQLVNMLHDVGMDTRGLDKDALVKACRTYHDLITIPEFSIDIPQASSSKSKTGVSASKDLPSLEHRRFAFPRPRPTLPLVETTRSEHQKGKGKAVASDTDDDWVQPSDQEMSDFLEDDVEVKDPKTNSSKDKGAEATIPGGVNQNRTGSSPGTESATSDQSKLITWLKTTLLDTQDQVEELESSYRILSGLVKRLVKDRDNDKKEDINTCGGRVAVSCICHRLSS
ncbi:uncharacterized protein MELLADRAFT_110084 [Melampsora larici-populina 98AG31]|uniref:Uncharacterized protein n=1 Tax=Melampsora larici-populina (strain 98AG31 / pathotype 3-4-7) TaxID=747676 RepID=F4RYL6_MELLP|nr:uncharacterized protein MELLADRAFT_110084 [Melampsora larici-populina 98AG31]EGG02557.1 hypothetical protein MELLADRAFT_110084 [Melampsora larici-populina 98AG31]